MNSDIFIGISVLLFILLLFYSMGIILEISYGNISLTEYSIDINKVRIITCGGYIQPINGCCGGTYSKETCCNTNYLLYERCKDHDLCKNVNC